MRRFTFERYHAPTQTRSQGTVDAPNIHIVHGLLNSWNRLSMLNLNAAWLYWIEPAHSEGVTV